MNCARSLRAWISVEDESGLLLVRPQNVYRCSTTGSMPGMPFEYLNGTGLPRQSVQAPNVDGAGERIRTPDQLITNQLLYQLSYAG